MGRDNFVAPKVTNKREVPDVLGAIFADNGRPTQVVVSLLQTNGGTQMRAGLDDSTVFEYTQAMVAAGGWGDFPAVVAYHDGKDYWLADGFHRVQAFKDGFPDATKTIPVEVRAGTRRDAILHAAGANASHGLRRSNADKRRAVDTLLRDEEWAAWSDGEISRRCGVSDRFVSSVRKELTPNGSEIQTTRTVTRGGTTYTQNTANIGKPAAAVLNTAAPGPRTPKVDDGYDEVRVSQPIVYTYEEMRKIAGDHLARGIAARKEDDEAIEHPLDCYEDPEYEARWHDPGTEEPDWALVAKQDFETLDRLKWPRRMRDLWELKDWFKQTVNDKFEEYRKLTGHEVPAIHVAGLQRMMGLLEQEMDGLQGGLEAKMEEAAHANQ